MAVKADCTASVKIVDQHVFIGQGMMVGRYVSPVHAQGGIALALAHVAQNLVVGAVLLDDEKHVLDSERGQVLHSACRFQLRRVRGAHFAHPRAQLRRKRGGNDFDQPLILA